MRLPQTHEAVTRFSHWISMLTRYTEWRSLRTVRLALHLKPRCAALARVLRSAPAGMKTVAALQPSLLGSLTLAVVAPTLFGNTVTVS